MLILSFAGCGSESSTEIFYAMDTVMTVTVYGSGAKKASKASYNEVKRLEKLLSVTDEDSEIYALNHRFTSDVSEETAALIEMALEISRETDGAFDITIYPVSLLWGFITKDYKVPSADKISEALTHCGSENISVSGTHINLPEGYMIDLGGIAKGYIADKTAEYLSANGVTSATINLGGNVFALGSKTDGTDFIIGIQDPASTDGSIIGYVSVSNKSLVTSGSYERYFIQDGKKYHHILDPKTGYPVENGLTAVSIISDKSVDGDGLSTTCFVLGLDKGMELINSIDGVEAVFIDENEQYYFSEGFGKDIIFNYPE